MTEDVFDVDGGDAGVHQVACVGVAERVRCGPDIEVGPFPVEFDNLLHAAHRERAVAAILEERGGRRGGEAPHGVEGEEFVDARLGDGVEGHHAAARAFADGGGKVEKPARLAGGCDEVRDKARAFPDAEPGVVEEEDEQVIPLAEGVCEIHGVENPPDFEFGQSEHFWKNLLVTSDLCPSVRIWEEDCKGYPHGSLARHHRPSFEHYGPEGAQGIPPFIPAKNLAQPAGYPLAISEGPICLPGAQIRSYQEAQNGALWPSLRPAVRDDVELVSPRTSGMPAKTLTTTPGGAAGNRG